MTNETLKKLREKSENLTSYQEFIINDINTTTGGSLEIITPKNTKDRGCQLSIVAHGYGRKLFDEISEKGVVADWREPNVIRIAPAPLYNSFEDCWHFAEVLGREVS